MLVQFPLQKKTVELRRMHGNKNNFEIAYSVISQWLGFLDCFLSTFISFLYIGRNFGPRIGVHGENVHVKTAIRVTLTCWIK